MPHALSNAVLDGTLVSSPNKNPLRRLRELRVGAVGSGGLPRGSRRAQMAGFAASPDPHNQSMVKR